MERLQFKIEINAPVNNVYDALLGLSNKQTYSAWTAIFNPTSTYEGTWEKGSKILFVGTDENGNRGGMVSKVEEHIPAQFVSICHYGFIQGDQEVTTGEMVEKWAGGHENYTFTFENNKTTVMVDIDVIDEYLDYFHKMYPAALQALKEIVEN